MQESKHSKFRPLFWALAILFAASACFYVGLIIGKKTCVKLPGSPAADKALRADSLRSYYQAKIRAGIDSTKRAMQTRQKAGKQEHQRDRDNDQAAEAAYYAGTTPCDSVIRAKNKTIKTGSVLIARADSLAEQDSLKAVSFLATIAGKDTTINDLAAENKALQNRKPPVMVYGMAGLEKWGTILNPEIGAAITFPNGFLVSYSKGILNDTHRAGIGFKVSLLKKKR